MDGWMDESIDRWMDQQRKDNNIIYIILKVNVVILAWLRNGTFLSHAEKISVFVFAAYIIIITPIGWFGVS